MKLSLENICDKFKINGHAVAVSPYGNGHINQTFLVNTSSGDDYILQKINSNIFKDVPSLMNNISKVTNHLFAKLNDSRRVLTIVKTLDNCNFLKIDDSYFRMYIFVKDSLCLEKAESLDDFYQSGFAFGEFQQELSDFDSEKLVETLPDFHDTNKRFQSLIEAVNENPLNRVSNVTEELSFIYKREKDCSLLLNRLKNGDLRLRVTHNDTKLNNVLLDKSTHKALCVIDLDTVMPGLVANDFGDSIRFGASTASEDEPNLSRVNISLELYKSFSKGFLSGCGNKLENSEIETLPLGAKLMTLECGIRFLTDYILGDKYFKIKSPEHNLFRCRTQLKLVKSMEDNWNDMNKIIMEVKKQ